MNHFFKFWNPLLICFISIVAAIGVHAALAEEAEPTGPIVQIAPDSEAKLTDGALVQKKAAETEPVYWIGIQGHSITSPVLRTHLQLAEDMGVVVEQVIPESPADKAGLRRHDILLRANGDAVDNMRVLQQHVLDGKEKPIELRIIRLGKEEMLVVVPEVRPEQFAQPRERALFERFRNRGDRQEALGHLFEQLQGNDAFDELLRHMGPGAMLQGEAIDINALPNGVSVSIHRENNGPAQITVKRGNQNWNVVGDDPESLAQLPDDLRPFVEQMLHSSNVTHPMNGMPFGDDLKNVLPRAWDAPGTLPGQMQKRLEKQESEISERMEQLEKRLRELQERLDRGEPAQGE